MKTPSKTNNQFLIDYAFPGLCSYCHSEIAYFEGSLPNGSPKITRFKANCNSRTMKLDDGSSMRIMLCNDCVDIKPDDIQYLMESEINGWQADVNKNDKMNSEEKLDYMEKYSKRTIINVVETPFSEDEIKEIKSPRIDKLNILVRK